MVAAVVAAAAELTNTMILTVEIVSGNCCNKENMLENSTLSVCQTLCLLQVFKYIWMNITLEGSNSSGVCIKTTMNFSKAISPAFNDIPSKYWPR